LEPELVVGRGIWSWGRFSLCEYDKCLRPFLQYTYDDWYGVYSFILGKYELSYYRGRVTH